MAVRNLMSIGSRKPIPIYVWIPPQFDPIHKIEVVTSTTTYDVTDIVTIGEYSDGITGTIGNFSIKIDNSSQTYLSTFNLYDQIKIYLDYGATASTLRFVGVIERISKDDHNLVITGRSLTAKYMGKNVTYAATDTARSTILSAIITKYFIDLTTTNLETDSTTDTVNYFDKPFWEVVEEICNASGFDAYVDKDSDFHYFQSGSRTNTTEAAIHEYNLIKTGDFSPDATNIFNKIKVYGVESGGVPLIATAEDSASQTTYGVKELKINDSSITTFVQAQARADFELTNRKDPVTIGEIESLGLPTLQPGEMVRISDPLNGLNPNYYQIHKFVHKFSNDEPIKTILTVQKERLDIPQIIKQRLKFESQTTAISNPNEHDYSRLEDFSTDSGTHSNTQILINPSSGIGVLKTDGGSSGTWTSDLISLDSFVTAVEYKFDGINSSGTQFFISTDGGSVYLPMIPGSLIPTGKKIKTRVVLNSATTEIYRLAFMYTF